MRQALIDERHAACPDGADRRVAVDYVLDDRAIVREATAGRFSATSRMRVSVDRTPSRDDGAGGAAVAGFWNALELEGARPQVPRDSERRTVRVVDLFCGCGGLSLGIKHAAEAVGLRPVFRLAVDVDEAALGVYARNLRPLRRVRQNVGALVDRSYGHEGDGSPLDPGSLHIDRELAALAGEVDLFLAGPPCEGNSNLNNRTRRSDVRNELYLDAVAVGIALGAKAIIIENVPSVMRSRQDVIGRSLRMLAEAGYGVDDGFTLRASNFGTPQNRRRYFLIAGQSGRTVSAADFDALRVPAPTVGEALATLVASESGATFDRPSRLSPDNERRVGYLVDEDKYDLPDGERPDCHRLKNHSYPSVYGRLRPDEVAPTITTGFLSPGRGRFTHPFKARSLTPHEGARLQGFGESFDWLHRSGRITRSDYANMIGAAVPPQLGFAVGMCALAML